MTAAFWSRFKSVSYPGLTVARGLGKTGFACQASRSYLALAFGDVTSLRGRFSLHQVASAGRVDLDARPLRGGHHDRPQVLALRRGRLGADQLLDHGLVVLQQRTILERR